MNFEEKTVSSEEIYDGKIIKVRKEKVELPDGRLATRELIGHPGGVGIIAVDGDGRQNGVRRRSFGMWCKGAY